MDGPGEVKDMLDEVEAVDSVRPRAVSKRGDRVCEEAVLVEKESDVLSGAIWATILAIEFLIEYVGANGQS